MSTRLTNKAAEPSLLDIRQLLGPAASVRLDQLECWLRSRYDINRALRFPFGASYGWGYKYSHKQAHLCYVFFERDAFTVTLQIGDARVPALTAALPSLQPATQQLWKHRYPCGKQGGWVHLQVHSDADLKDAQILIDTRKPGEVRATALK